MLINWNINNGRLYVCIEFSMLNNTLQKTTEQEQTTTTTKKP